MPAEAQNQQHSLDRNCQSPARRWSRFIVGLLLFSAIITTLMSGATPPGVCGEVLRHNQQAKIDASPLFYSEVDHMQDLIRAVESRRQLRRTESPLIDN